MSYDTNLAKVAPPLNRGPLSLSGAPLLGRRLMRLVYLDEAGISNKAQEPFLVVGGIIVHADQKLNAVERHLDRLVERYIPSEHQSDFVFHAKEIFNGGGIFGRPKTGGWPLSKRLEIAADLAQIPAKFGLPIMFGFVERATFPATMDWPANLSGPAEVIGAHATAFMSCAMQVEQWMRVYARDEVCVLIAEDNDNARSTIRETLKYLQTRDMAGVTDVKEHAHFPLRKIKEDPLFQSKRKSSPLQIADFCAYVFKRMLMNNDDEHYSRFWEPMRKQLQIIDDKRIYERAARSLRRSSRK